VKFAEVELHMISEELVVLDGNSALWKAARPLLVAALRLDRRDDGYSWHGWNKEQIGVFLKQLPSRCSLVLGVWEIVPGTSGIEECENLIIGLVCEVVDGSISSVRTFESLVLKSVERLEPGIQDALEVMRQARMQVAPVAWALFIDKVTWETWLFAEGVDGAIIDKGELLASFVRQGRCVLLGSSGESHSSKL
jgi:hypothetical protein